MRLMHYLPIEQIFKKLESSPVGLSEKEAAFRLRKHGENRLPDGAKFAKLAIFLRQFKNPLILILAAASSVSFLLGDYFDSAIILAAVILNVIIAYFQEEKADEALNALKKIVVEKAYVFRDGYLKEKPSAELVPGDVIFLKTGGKILADARIIEAKNLSVSESALTGEWLPVEKKTGVMSPDAPLAERSNSVFMGTMVDSGEGKAVVAATGTKTEFGKIAGSLAAQKEKATPLQKKLARFSRNLSIIVVLLAVLIFISGLLRNVDFVSIFVLSVALAVAAVPEGLPGALTVILAIGMKRILQKGGLVKSLLSAETLGGATVICVDKTGTLTTGEMQVANILTTGRELLSENGKYSEDVSAANGLESHILALEAATLCNEAFIENPDDEFQNWVIRGRMTDKALIAAGMQAGLKKPELEKRYPRLDLLPFDSFLKFQATLHRFDENHNVIYAAGSPEALLKISKTVRDGGREEISENLLKKLITRYEELSGKGLRLVAAAYKKVKKDCAVIDKNDLKDFVLIGFIALKDPLRPEIKEAMENCGKAGIRIIMITGDHKLTAEAIGREIGLDADESEILDGKEVEKMSDEELEKLAAKVKIFARSSPSQKLRIVNALQNNGEIVAMTGDGVNDAPALKKADIGIVLESGTDVAKETGDLILLNNSFSVIVSAIEQGKIVFDNLRKVVVYLISDSFTEVAFIGAVMLFNMPVPLLPAQILWVNLIEDGLPSFSLAFEEKEKDVMKMSFKNLKISLWSKEMRALFLAITFVNVFLLLGLYFLFSKNGAGLDYIRTMIFSAIGVNSLFYVFSCKSLRSPIWKTNLLGNKYLLFASLFGFLMLFAGVYVPFFQWVLKTVPLAASDWLVVFSVGLLNIAAIEMVKGFAQKFNRQD